MTFEQFAFLQPGSIVRSASGDCVYARPLRDHPMAKTIAKLTGLPITPSPVSSVMGQLREAYRDVWFSRPDGLSHPGTDEEILSHVLKHSTDSFSYFRALVIYPDGSESELSPDQIWARSPEEPS